MATGVIKHSQSNDLAYSGIINDGNTVILTPEAGCMYMLFTFEYNSSTGNIRGHRCFMVSAPAGETFGTAAAAHQAMAQSTNSGVTITWNNNSTISLARSGANFAVKYAMMKIY